MPTYDNCYEIASDVRRGLNEFSTGLVEATDTSGAYPNSQILKAINDAQKFIYHILIKRIRHEFEIHDQDLVFTNSIATYPSNFGRLIQLKNQLGRQAYFTDIKDRVPTTSTGSNRLYFRKKGIINQLQIERSGVNETWKISYIVKPRDIHWGQSSDGGALSLTLDALYAKKIVDYYNDMFIENATDDWVDTIDDYTAARVATLAANTGAASKYYGLVSEIPESFQHLIAPKAAMLVKNASPVTQEKVTQQESDDWVGLLLEALRGFEGTEDTDYEDVFTDFEPIAPTTGIIPLR